MVMNESQLTILDNGDQCWLLNDQLHRTDGPAAIRVSGDLEWWQHGELHRTDGPARVSQSPDQEWWYLNDRIHRSDGPAIVCADGEQHWFSHGVRHRSDGPAVVFPQPNSLNRENLWYVQGVDVTLEINTWMDAKGVAWPWDDEVQMEFALTFL